MPFYRCHNPACAEPNSGKLGFNFEAETPVCPKCKAGEIPRTAGMIVKLSLIHFDPPSGVFGIGKGYPACRPDKTLNGIRATGAHVAVTCATCRQTQEFKDSYEAEQPWDGNMEVEIDPKAGTMRRLG